MTNVIPAYLLCMTIIFIKVISDTHSFQQFGYYVSPYIKYTNENRFYPDYILYFLALVLMVTVDTHAVVYILLPLLFLYFQSLILRTTNQKTPLVYTKRIVRLLITTFFIIFALILLCHLWITKNIPEETLKIGEYRALRAALSMTFLLIFILSDYILVLSNFINRPMENLINNRYVNDAKRIIKSAPFLKIVGITGSYGKTSTKSIVGEMLKNDFNTLIPPSSYNTKLGLTRTIRENLVPTTEFFIAEMGAKQLGEIKETAEFIRPDIAVITSIGEQHLETFKSEENILKEKSEIFHNLKENGIALINIDFPELANLSLRKDIKKITYSVDKEADYYVDHISADEHGYRFELVDNRDFNHPKRILLHTKLLGKHNISNILASAVIALEMGVGINRIQHVVSQLTPVKNRLSLRVEKDVTILEDAFNSNPVGAKAALDVLRDMPANNRIIMTPGMIELGEKEEEVHINFGKQISHVCDVVILIGKNQTKNIYKGLLSQQYDPDKIHIVQSMREAFSLKNQLAKQGDVVLIENDLPEIFEN